MSPGMVLPTYPVGLLLMLDLTASTTKTSPHRPTPTMTAIRNSNPRSQTHTAPARAPQRTAPRIFEMSFDISKPPMSRHYGGKTAVSMALPRPSVSPPWLHDYQILLQMPEVLHVGVDHITSVRKDIRVRTLEGIEWPCFS